MKITRIERKPDSSEYIEIETVYSKVKVTCHSSVEDLLQIINSEMKDYCMVILPESFVFSRICEGCGKEILINVLSSLMRDEQRWCESCRSEIQCNFPEKWTMTKVFYLNMKNKWVLQKKLSELSVPLEAILTVIGIGDNLAKQYKVCID